MADLIDNAAHEIQTVLAAKQVALRMLPPEFHAAFSQFVDTQLNEIIEVVMAANEKVLGDGGDGHSGSSSDPDGGGTH